MKTITVKIDGMHCASCPIMIDGTLEDEIAGVASSQTSYAKQECVISYDEASVTTDRLLKAIQEIGYSAHVDEI